MAARNLGSLLGEQAEMEGARVACRLAIDSRHDPAARYARQALENPPGSALPGSPSPKVIRLNPDVLIHPVPLASIVRGRRNPSSPAVSVGRPVQTEGQRDACTHEAALD
jgi:hypothetical protein